MNPKSRKALVRHVEQWGDPFPPACRCGCGEPVRFGQRRQFNTYVNTAHASWDRWKVPTGKIGHIHGETIDVADFRAAVLALAKKRGVSLGELAMAGGWSPGRLRGVIYGTYPYILKDTARAFFMRLAGMSTPPTPWEIRQRELLARNGRKAAHEIRLSHLKG